MVTTTILCWVTPSMERIIALAMRRCYSTKPIEELEGELDQKGPEYTAYLVRKAVSDKAFDVIEHAFATFYVEDADQELTPLLGRYHHVNATRIGRGWLLTLNARTLYEMSLDENNGVAKALADCVAPLAPNIFRVKRD